MLDIITLWKFQCIEFSYIVPGDTVIDLETEGEKGKGQGVK